MKKYIFLFSVLCLLIMSYTEISYLMYTKLVAPPIPGIKQTDIMSFDKIEMSKHTGLDWLFWNSESYIDYSWEHSGNYINIYFTSVAEVMNAKIYWGVNNIYENQSNVVEVISGVQNAICIPKKEYNCARIYFASVSEDNIDDVDKQFVIWIYLKEISVVNGSLDWLRLYGGTLILWALGVFFVWALLYGKNSWCRNKNLKYRRLFSFFCIWALFLFVKQYLSYNGICYFADAGKYYGLGETFIKEGKFSFYNYLSEDSTYAFRGYFQPLLILLFKLPGKIIPFIGPDKSYDLVSCAFFAAFFAWGAEYLAQKAMGKNSSFIMLLGVPCLLYVFGRGLIAYPLSDLYNTVFCLGTLCCIYKLLDSKNDCKNMIYAVFTGMGMYATYNIRSAWLLFVIIDGALLLICLCRQGMKKIVFSILGIGIGIYILGLPQYIINDNICDTKSIMIQNNNYSGGESLALLQLKGGLDHYRYESCLMLGNDYQTKQWEMQEKAAYITEINEIHSITDYVKFAFRRPVYMLKVMIRHLSVVLDMKYPNIINKRIDITNPLQRIYAYIFWMLFVFTFFQNVRYIKIGKNILNLCFWGGALLPAIAQCMGGFESRFAITIYIVCAMFILYLFDAEQLKNFILQNFQKNKLRR